MAAQDSNFKWSDLAEPAVGAGAQILGKKMETGAQQAMSREQIAEQKRQFDIRNAQAQSELARRNMLFGVAAPGMFRNLGYQPSQIRPIVSQLRQPAGTPPTLGSVVAKMPPQGSGGGSAAKIASIAGTAAGVAGAAGVGIPGAASAILGAGPAAPIAAGVVGAGLLAKHLIGRGRRAADELTHPGGMQNAFEGVLKDIDASGMNPDEAWKLKRQAYDELVQLGMAHAQKGNDFEKRTVSQMFDTISPLFGQQNPLRQQAQAMQQVAQRVL